jgi:hypothetical protein
METRGLKFDKDKLMWELLPLEPIEDVVKILTFGAKKYAPNNWKLVDDAEARYYAAAVRHLVAWRQGELIDPESGEPHLAHLMCNVVFLSWLEKERIKQEKLRDQQGHNINTPSPMNAPLQKEITTSVQNAVREYTNLI